MNPLERLEALPLRRRFLVPPVLGLVLLAGMITAFFVDSSQQNALLSRVAIHDLANFERHSQLFGRLSEHHMAVFDLLHDARQKVSEEELYDRSKARMSEIRADLEHLRALVGPEAVAASEDHDQRLHAEVLQRAQEYVKSVSLAVEMATVDVSHAGKRLVAANERFVAMNHAYSKLLDEERAQVRAEIIGRVEASRSNALRKSGIGFGLALLVAAFSFALVRLLSRRLEIQIAALSELGAQVSPALDGAQQDEVSRIARAISAFCIMLEKLRSQERSLSEANERLESRVVARTRELTSANAELNAEVGRRVEAERHLRIYEAVIQNTGEAVAIADTEGRIIEVNPAYERNTEIRRQDAIGTPFFGTLAGADSEQARGAIWTALRCDGHWSGEVLDRRRGGETFPAWVTANAVHDTTGGGYFVSVARDITALKESEQQLQKLAFFDPLTGLANRALLNDRMRVALAGAARANEKAALLYIDLDRFKYVNDTLGHEAGDKLLIEISRRLSAQVRATDTLARLGGDEFTILLTGVGSEEDIAAAAQRIIDAVRRPVEIGDETVFVGASVGIAMYPTDHHDPEILRKYADLAMYEAKQAGRGQYRRFCLDMIDRAGQRLSLTTRMETALEENGFSLDYQPIVDMSSGVTTGVEALIRWRQPDGSFIPPATFIPHAEEAGLIKRIDCWVLERACTEVAGWSRQSGQPIEVSVNLSAVSLQQPDLATQLQAVLERTGLPANQLRLEITETAVIANPKAAADVLRAISDMGVGISLDDFGTGYSSLNYLIQFPIDRIKLDRSFIERIGKDKASEAIIRSLLALAGQLKIGVVAEGVEQLAQHDFLYKAGCSHVQGFHISRPLTPDNLLAHLSAYEIAA